MRTFFTGILLLLSVFRAIAAEDFEAGNQAYSAGDYDGAIAAWEGLVDEGYAGLELYYNLGNARFRQGELGEAVWWWKRAALHAPFDRDVRKNLEIAAGLQEDRLEPAPRLALWDALDRLLWSLPPNMLALGLLLAVALASLCLSLRLARLSFSSRPILLAGTWTGASLGLLLLLLLALQVRVREQNREAVIVAPQVTLLGAPLVDAEALFDLHEGTTLAVDRRSGEWLSLRLPDGREGWCPPGGAKVVEP